MTISRHVNNLEIFVFSKGDVGLLGSWKVTGYDNGVRAVVSVISTSAITLNFAESRAVTGNAGVNQYNARCATSGTEGLEIGPIATTIRRGRRADGAGTAVPRGAVGSEDLPAPR